MDDSVRKMLEEKYAEQLGNINTGQAFANLGDVIAGKSVGSTNPYFTEQRGLAKDQTLGQFDRQQALELKKAKEYQDMTLKMLQLAQQKNLGESNLDVKKMMAELRAKDLAQKSEERKQKEQELSSAQAKQLGLAEMGQLANKQYQDVISKGYDPTSYKNKMDTMTWAPQFLKSDEGKKALAAQNNWVEAYLRDASGAAIAASEREAYANDFFPRPGDTPDIVANKDAMRKQKEANALLGAGTKGLNKFEKSKLTVPKIGQGERKSYQGKTYELVGKDRNDPNSWKIVGE